MDDTGGSVTRPVEVLLEELFESSPERVDVLGVELLVDAETEAILAIWAWWADQATPATPTEPATAKPAVRVDRARVPDLRAAAP